MMNINFDDKTNEEIAALKFSVDFEYNRRMSGYTPPIKKVEIAGRCNVSTETISENIRQCDYCGNDFVARVTPYYVQKYCNQSCSGKAGAKKRFSTFSTDNQPNLPEPTNETTTQKRQCKQCGKDIPATANPLRVFCGTTCREIHYSTIENKEKATSQNRAIVEYSERHMIISELLSIAGISLSKNKYFVYSGKLYSTFQDYSALSALYSSIRRSKATGHGGLRGVNRLMEIYLGATPEKVRIQSNDFNKGTFYKVMHVDDKFVTFEDKEVVLSILSSKNLVSNNKIPA